MSLFEAIILGIVQGLTEFLPISSSAHLLMVPWIAGWTEPPFVFDTSLHIGTLIALLIYFRTDIINLLVSFIRLLKEKNIKENPDGRLAVLIIIGSIPAGLIGFLFENIIEKKLHSPYIIVTTLIVLGIFLWLIDRLSKKTRTLEGITVKDAIVIGIAQAMALIPGTSRSGITMTAALLMNFNRETAARFSFLLSIPITAAAALFKLKDLLKMNMTSEVITNFSVGILVSGIVGFLCIKYLLKFLRTNSFAVFAIYRIIVGLFLLFMAPGIKIENLE